MKEAVKIYNDHGFACLPTKQNKNPKNGLSWKSGFPPESFIEGDGLGLICGKLSGGLECFDFDNHFGDAKDILTKFVEIPEVKEIFDRYKFPIEITQRGGYHLYFRCAKNEGNKKLASRANDKGIPEALIETRGEGGYVCAEPMKGYKFIRNDILQVPTITEVERAILFDNARSLTEFYPKLVVTEHESGDKPGDLYNRDADSISQSKEILLSAGWKDLGNKRWRRPGKSEGISATFGHVAENVFYVFSSNAYPFELNKGYSPFQILGLVKFDGDFKAAAQSLTQYHSKPVTAPQPIQTRELDKILLGAKIDPSRNMEKPPTILFIRESVATSSVLKRVFTLGNFSCIIGKAKSKKTYLISLLTASLINKDCNNKFFTDLPKGKSGILYFDTEQGEYDSWNVIKRIEYMARGLANMKAYNLRAFSPVERCQIIEYAFQLYGAYVGFCVIDGVADLANGINDEDEATRVTTLLLRWSKVYNCHIVTVLHQNKNDNYATGHIGSAVMKKSEIVLSVTKSKDNPRASDVSNEMSRGMDFEPFQLIVNDDGLPEVGGSVPRRAEPLPSFTEEKETIDVPF